MHKHVFHLLPNAHIDPVWLWDFREGLNEGITTCRTMLDLMDEYPDLTFIRGESAIYRHIEKNDPATFRRIRKYAKEGRWDIVGGTYVQPDTNLPATETFARHFLYAQNYFISRFGKSVKIAWATDSFGHSAGIPEILSAAGISGYAFSRPAESIISISKPAFWWEGSGGSRILAYRIPTGCYCCERHDMANILDRTLDGAEKWDMTNIGVFFGLGNHGGGSTRRMIAEAKEWSTKHHDVKVIFSTLHGLFSAINGEIKKNGTNFIPVHKGELNFCLRGCYASLAKFKYSYRKSESLAMRSERTISAISAGLDMKCRSLDSPWKDIVFNSFHDIIPGSSIERAYDEQLEQIGGAMHQCRKQEFKAMNALASQVDCSVEKPSDSDHPAPVSFIVFNPNPFKFDGYIELENCLDYRPIWKYQNKVSELPVEIKNHKGKTLPLQLLDTEHNAFPQLAWRYRALVKAEIPPMGWSIFQMGWNENLKKIKIESSLKFQDPGSIENEHFKINVKKNGTEINIIEKKKGTRRGISLITVEDPWGSWGGMDENPDSCKLSTIRHTWKITDFRINEKGPERVSLWVRMTGGNSTLDFLVFLYQGRKAVDFSVRLLWNERAARLKMIIPECDKAEFEIPGGRIVRSECGEVPGGRWIKASGKSGGFGFASNALYCFDIAENCLRTTIARASRYASDVVVGPEHEPWRPAVDRGELKFNFIISSAEENIETISTLMEIPPVTLSVPPGKGTMPRSGSFLEILPAELNLLALKPASEGKGWIIRLQNNSGLKTTPKIKWLGSMLTLPEIGAGKISTFRLISKHGKWISSTTDITEK